MPNKNRQFTLAASCIVLVVCLCLAEIGIRLYHHTNDRQRFIWLPDQFLGYVHSRNNRFKHHYTETETITVDHTTNSFGLLGDQIKRIKSAGTFRVLVLGDSFTEAIQVPQTKNFCARLQSLLAGVGDSPYQTIEVLNAGVSGYSPLNYYLNYVREWHRLKPDLVLVQLFANDVFEDNTARAKSILDEEGLPVSTGRYFSEKITRHPPISQEEFNRNPLSYRLLKFMIERSRFFEYVYVKIYNRQKASKYHQKTIREDQYGTGYQFFILDPEHVLTKDSVFRERAWGYTQQYLSALKRAVERDGARVAMFYMPTEAQLDLNTYGEHISLYITKKMGTFFNDMLAGFSVRNVIEFHDLLPVFEQNMSKGLYLNRDGHLTEAGHAVTARSLFLYILDNNLMEAKPEEPNG